MNLGLFALRNLGRSRLRTGLQVGGVGLITAIMLVWGCLNTGLGDLLTRSATDLDVGELQLHAAGYVNSPDLYTTMPYTEAWQQKLNAAGLAAAPRLYGFALAAIGKQSTGVQIRAVDLDAEPKVTEIDRHISKGKWLEHSSPQDVVIGRVLARRLHVKIGQELVLLTQAADGAAANALFRVRGVLLPASNDIDERGIYMSLAAFQQYYHLERGVHEVALKRISIGDPLEKVRQRLSRVAPTLGPSVEVLTWRQVKPVLAKMLDILSISSKFIFCFVYLSLGGLIINIGFMSIYNRLSEFGTMTALGMTPRQILALILAESSWLGLFNSITAWVIGIPVALILSRYGLDLRWFFDHWAMAGITMQPILYARLGWGEMLTPVAVMFLSLNLFSLYPGLDAARMQPSQALAPR